MDRDMLQELFGRLEAAIDIHERLARVPGSAGEPELRVSRDGVSAWIRVRRIDSRKRPSHISAQGDTAHTAVASLIASLDTWAEAIR